MYCAACRGSGIAMYGEPCNCEAGEAVEVRSDFDEDNVSEPEFNALLMDLVNDAAGDNTGTVLDGGARVWSFDELGLLTRDKGFEVRLANGNVFQVTVKRAKVREY